MLEISGEITPEKKRIVPAGAEALSIRGWREGNKACTMVSTGNEEPHSSDGASLPSLDAVLTGLNVPSIRTLAPPSHGHGALEDRLHM